MQNVQDMSLEAITQELEAYQSRQYVSLDRWERSRKADLRVELKTRPLRSLAEARYLVSVKAAAARFIRVWEAEFGRDETLRTLMARTY